MKGSNQRSWAWATLGLALLLATPNCGLGTVLGSIGESKDSTRIVKTERHGEFELVGYSILMNDHVGIFIQSPIPGLTTQVLRHVGRNGLDTFPADLMISEEPQGIRLRDHPDSAGVFLSDTEIELLRFIGPRILTSIGSDPLNGKNMSLGFWWHWTDLLDTAILLLIAAVLFQMSNPIGPSRP